MCSPPALSEAPLGGRRLSRRSRPCLARDRPSPGGFPSVICRGASASASACASCSFHTPLTARLWHIFHHAGNTHETVTRLITVYGMVGYWRMQ